MSLVKVSSDYWGFSPTELSAAPSRHASSARLSVCCSISAYGRSEGRDAGREQRGGGEAGERTSDSHQISLRAGSRLLRFSVPT